MLPSADVKFNYDMLPPEKATSARAAAERIRGRLNVAFIETGRDLNQQKDLLGHGNFLLWVESEFGMSERSAQNLMSVSLYVDANPQHAADLEKMSMRALTSLSAKSTPEPVRQEVLARAEAGEKVTAKEIEELRKKLAKTEDAARKAAEAATLMEGRAQTIERELEGANLARLYAEQDMKRISEDLITANEEIERLREPGVITQFNDAFVEPVAAPTPWTDDDAQFHIVQKAWRDASMAARVRFMSWAGLTSLSDDIAA